MEMVDLLTKGVAVCSVNLPKVDLRLEFLQNSITGELLTNPYESIVNCLANIEVLAQIAEVISVEPSEHNLECLFETILQYVDNNSKGMIV